MSGTAISRVHRAAECTVDANGHFHYTVYYRVSMSSAADGPQEVVEYLEANDIEWGVSYSFSSTDRDAGTFCNGVQVRRIPNSTTEWEATVTYGPPDVRQNTDGDLAEDADTWEWQINMGYACWQMPVWKAYNRTSFPHPDQALGGGFTRPAGTLGPVVNSANSVLDPTLMRDVYDRVIQITTYSLRYDGSYSDAYMGAINSSAVSISAFLQRWYGMSAQTFGQYTVKCTDASATRRIARWGSLRIPYWEWTWEFRIRATTWLEEVLDRGITRRPMVGEEGEENGNMPDRGVAVHSPILDSDDRRVPELVNFDGGGFPIQPDDPNWSTGYWFWWQVDPSADFTLIPFDFFD